MITQDKIKITARKDGIYLSAKTDKGDYGQFYNTIHPDRNNFVANKYLAMQRFMAFYNQFE